MKLLTIPIAVLLAVSMVAATDFISDESSISASLLYYQPVPAQPGDQLDVWIQIENDGGKASQGGTITILGNEIFILENERDRVKVFPSIPPQEAFLVTTKVRVSKGATEGTSNLAVRIQEDDATGTVEKQLPITVVGTTSTLSIVSAETTPKEILPGETAHLEVKVKNIGSTQVRNVDVTLDLDGLSLAPSGSSNSKAISILAAGEEHVFAFDIVSYPDAEAQAYRIPVSIDYDDEQGNERDQNETVGFVIGATPELLVYFEDVDITGESMEGEVVLKFVNKGLAEIKLLEVEIFEESGIEVMSESPVVYVGNIDEDDYESADVYLKVSDGTEEVQIRVAYKDALNRQYEETLNIPLRVQAGQNGGGTSPVVWILILALLVGGFFWYRRRRK